jgi:hypothetical protein
VAKIDYTTDSKGVVTAQGDINILATDKSGIYSNTKIVSSSITTNNGGMTQINETIADFTEVDYLSGDGTQSIEFGDKIRLADDYASGGEAGRVYIYMGEDGSIDLSSEDYSDIGYWKEDASTQIVPEGLNISNSDSMAIGGLVVRNDVRSGADAI